MYHWCKGERMINAKTDALILDVDGTLWDSTPIVARAWQAAVSDRGLSDYVVTPDRLKELFGKTMQVIAEELFPDLPGQQRTELMERCCAYEHEALRQDTCAICYPGVISCIQALSERLPVCIVSNCQSGYIELFLEKTGLGPYIMDTECYGNTKKEKGENISLLVQRNHFLAPVYVGDTQGDCDAAKAAGVVFIHASYGYGKVDCAAEVIPSFSGLLKLFEL